MGSLIKNCTTEFLKPQQILEKKVYDYHQVVFETLGFAFSEESFIGDYKSTCKYSPFSIKIYSQNALKKKKKNLRILLPLPYPTILSFL